MGDLDWQSIFATLGDGVGTSNNAQGSTNNGGGGGRERNVVNQQRDIESGTSTSHNLNNIIDSPSNIDYTLPQHQQYQPPQRPKHSHRHSLPQLLPLPYNDAQQTQQLATPIDNFPSVPPPTPLIPRNNPSQPHRTVSDHDFYTNLTRSLYSHDSFIHNLQAQQHVPSQTQNSTQAQINQSSLDTEYLPLSTTTGSGQSYYGLDNTSRDSTSYGLTDAQRELEARTKTRGRTQFQQQGMLFSSHQPSSKCL